MAYPINPHDIIEVSYRGTIAGQIVMNVFHFQYTGAVPLVPGDAALQTLLTNLAAPLGFQAKLLGCSCPEYTMTEQRAQVIYPTRQIYLSNTISLPGIFAGSSLTPNTSAVVLKVPSLAGRGRVGNVHVIATPSADPTGGVWSLVYIAKLGLFAAALPTLQTLSAPNDAMPVIWSRRLPTNPSQILAGRVNPFVRVERRRTVGVGQ